MLSTEQIASIASDLNEKVNIPFMGEGKEQSMIENALSLINDQLDVVVGALPDSAKELWEKVQDGVSADEAEELKSELVTGLNEKVNIPFLGEGQEAEMLIKPAVDLIVDTLQAKTGS